MTSPREEALIEAEERDTIADDIPGPPPHSDRHGSNKLRISSMDLTPMLEPDDDASEEVINMAAKMRRMTRLNSNVSEFYEFDMRNKLGTGNFSTVVKGINRGTGQEVAIKVISKDLVRRKDRLIDEIRMLKDMVERPNIIQLYDVFESDDKLFLVMQVAEGGELFDKIVEKQRFPENEAKILIKNLLEGVRDLHQRGIIHRDLKPENILMLSKDSDTDICISDFGLSKYFNDAKQTGNQSKAWDMRKRNRAFTCCGTDIYMAPEVLAGKGYSFEADLWSVGVICYCVLAGYPPFYHERDDIIKKLILRGQYEFYPEEWDLISEDAKDVVRSLLVVKPDDRGTWESVLTLKWFTY